VLQIGLTSSQEPIPSKISTFLFNFHFQLFKFSLLKLAACMLFKIGNSKIPIYTREILFLPTGSEEKLLSCFSFISSETKHKLGRKKKQKVNDAANKKMCFYLISYVRVHFVFPNVQRYFYDFNFCWKF